MSADERCAVVRYRSSLGSTEVYGLPGDDAKIFTPGQAKKIATDLWVKSGLMASVRVYASYSEAVKHLTATFKRVYS